MTIIGLTGLAGSGKSTVAKHLVSKHGFTILSFAGPLKKMMRTLDPIVSYTLPFGGSEEEAALKALRLSEVFRRYDGDELGVKKSGYGPEYRRLLQTLGTDCIRAISPNFWIDAAMSQMTDTNGRYVFDDVRFPNEAEVILEANPAGLWNLQRPDQEIVGGEHISEKHAGHMNESAYIINDDLDRLYGRIEYHLSIHV
jgi:Dephospho-CoA kinase